MITAVALPEILRDPRFADWRDLREASWIINGYLVAYIAVMPLSGRAADRFGLPRLLVLGLVTFAIGSILSGAAQDLQMLVAARILQGLGGGAMVPLATAAASHLYEGAGRARALGVVAAATFLGMAVGPVLGSLVLEHLDLSIATAAGRAGSPLAVFLAPSWRWVFYAGAPLALLVALYVWAAGPAWPPADEKRSLDLPGAALFTIALAATLIALTQGPDAAGPLGVPIAAVVAVAAGMLALLRMLRAREPFLDPRHFRVPAFTGSVLVSLLTGYALATAIIGAAVFVDRVRYAGPEEQRLVLGTLAGAMALGALGSGFLIRRTGIVPVMLVGLGAQVAGLLLLSGATPGTELRTLVGALALFGLGFGATVTPRSTAAAEALGRGAYGVAAAGVTVARMIGMAVGLATLSALGSQRIEALSVVLTDAAARDAVLPPALRGRPLEDGLVVAALETWAAGQAATILAQLFLVAAAVTAAAVLPTLWMRGSGRARALLGVQLGRDPSAAARPDDLDRPTVSL